MNRRKVKKLIKKYTKDKSKNYFGCIHELSPSNFKRLSKYARQLKERGWDDTETWALDYTIASFVYPRLIRYKKLNNGYPPDLTWETWNLYLDKMIKSMKYMIDGELVTDQDKFNEMEEGFNLFGKYFMSLGW